MNCIAINTKINRTVLSMVLSRWFLGVATRPVQRRGGSLPVTRLSILAMALAVSCQALPVQGQVQNWTNTTNNLAWFDQGFNWTPSGTPGPGSDVRFTSNSTYQVWWDAGTPVNSPNVGFLGVTAGNVTFLNLNASPQHLLTTLGGVGRNLSVSNATLNLQGVHVHSNLWGARIFDNGQLNVDGSHPSGSRLTVSGGFDFLDIDGTLNVTGPNAVVDSNNAMIGRGADTSGIVTVTGSGSHWISHNTILGGDGSGTLNVQDQGLVTSSSMSVNNGTLNVSDGGVVATAIGTIGTVHDTSGTVTVTGVGSRWTDGGSHSLFVGDRGSGALNVEAGGVVNYSFGSVGYQNGSSGTVTVTGSGSQWNLSGLHVGGQGTGTMNVAAGGVVTNGIGIVGDLTGSSGTVTVNGSGSQWNNTGHLYVGWYCPNIVLLA